MSDIAIDFASTNVMSIALAQNNMIGDFSDSYRYVKEGNYPSDDAYQLGWKLRAGELEYCMLAKEGSEQELVSYNFDSDKMLLK